jgi:hypothetical protein
MKSIILLLTVALSGSAFGQGLVFSSVNEVPSTLRLSAWGFTGEISHYEFLDNGVLLSTTEVIFTDGLESRLPVPGSHSAFLNCKGDFALVEGDHLQRSILAERIDMCVDDEGIPQYVRPGLSRSVYNRVLEELSAEFSPNTAGEDRSEPSKDYDPISEEGDGSVAVPG